MPTNQAKIVDPRARFRGLLDALLQAFEELAAEQVGADLLASRDAEIEDLCEQVDRLQTRIDAHRIIEQAKWLLVSEYKVSEQAAYKMLQKQASRNNRRLEEVAQSLVDAHELKESVATEA